MEASNDPSSPSASVQGQQRSFVRNLLARIMPANFDNYYYNDSPHAEVDEIFRSGSCSPLCGEESQPAYHTSFGGKTSLTSVRGYPSNGGLFVLNANSIELKFLGLWNHRFDETRRSDDPQLEDEFCSRMRMLGAVFWASESEWARHQLFGVDGPGRKGFEPEVIVGWPAAGGVWVIKTEEGQYIGVGRVNNAVDMEERCRVIEQLGGRFYADLKECPHLDLL